MKTIIATITNFAYVIAGIALPFEVGVFLIILGLASGIHHHVVSDFTRILDYLGMYLVGLAVICLAVGAPLWIAVVVGVLTSLLFKASRVAIGFIIAIALIELALQAGIEATLHVGTFLGIAFVFNHAGDNYHRKHHDLIHGVGWHVPTAYALLLTFNYLL